MLKGVEDVCVIDSFVIDKANFLKAYKLVKNPESSSLTMTISRRKAIIREQFTKQKSETVFTTASREKRV